MPPVAGGGGVAVAAVAVVARACRRWWRRCACRRRSAAGGGGARQNAQVNNSKADARTNNVRSTSVNNVNVDRNVNVNVERQQQLLQQRLGQRLSPGGHCGGGRRGGCRDFGRRRLDGAHRAARLRAGELRWHGLSAMRQHLVCPAGIAVRRGQSAVLIAIRQGSRSLRSFPFLISAGRVTLDRHPTCPVFGGVSGWSWRRKTRPPSWRRFDASAATENFRGFELPSGTDLAGDLMCLTTPATAPTAAPTAGPITGRGMATRAPMPAPAAASLTMSCFPAFFINVPA